MRGRTVFSVAVLVLCSANAVAGQPYDLNEVVRLALQHNPDLAIAAHRVQQAQARLGEAWSAFYPQIGASLQYARTDNPAQAFAMILAQRRFAFGSNFNQPGPTQDVRPEVRAMISVFRGGQDYFRARAALHGLEASQEELRAVRNALVDTAAEAYLSLLSAPEHVEVARVSRAALESALAVARSRSETGSGLRSDVLSLEARVAEAQEAELHARNAVELARAGLRTVLALPAEQPLEVIPSEPDKAALPESLEEVLARARVARPELRAAQAVLAAREAELASARAAYLPRIDLIGAYGQNATNLKLSASRDNWFFGATAEWDVFNGFRTGQRVRQAEEQVAEARRSLERTRLAVEHEAQRTFLEWQEAREREKVTQVGLTAAEEALRLVTAQYREGVVVVTRYLEAEAARTGARARAVTARYQARRSSFALRRAMGEWAEEEEGSHE